MTPAGIGLSPINPLALEPPEITPRQSTVRAPSGLSGITTPDTSNSDVRIRPPDPSSMSQGAENDLASPPQAFGTQSLPQPPSQNLRALEERGIGTQIDLVA